ncbi:MAG TPA: tetratricopeptide repeat protein [Thermoanaerobaculia bacterium]|jgi:tetratricopeptide (TPR) repeat protein|nr:tetratricopeptide repeat protein [Thermoanaerobaculia bacterium]
MQLDNLGSYHRGISTKSAEAQRWFDQGLRLLFSFNLEESQRSFEQAARLDPECAMCFWGVGMALGPHINLPGLPDRTKPANEAAHKALSLAGSAKPVEKALIEALVKRYSDPPAYTPEAQSALDTAYAEAMRDVHRRFPDDLDATALTAEALMDLHPWDLYTVDEQPQPWTAEILGLLEGVLAKNPDHPGANHYYIHAVEASSKPDRALASAGRIANLVPGAAHMVHMPSHIYARVGRWADASEANRKAIRVDKDYLAKAQGLGFYFMYAAHNYQFLWQTAVMEGRSAEALENARAVVEQSPVEMLRQMPGYDFVLEYPIWTRIWFGQWEDALAEPGPPVEFTYANAVWHAARGLALAHLKRLNESETERVQVVEAEKATPAEAPQGLNSAHALLGIARRLVEAQQAVLTGDTNAAVATLEEAVREEDKLRYNEPPDWYFPVRHALGEALNAAGRGAEAQKVWEEALRRHPENGWALSGLAESLRLQKKEAEAAKVLERRDRAWSQADAGLKLRR